MNSNEILSNFIDRYIAKNRKERWRALIHKKDGIYKNINQLEAHLNGKCKYINVNNRLDVLHQFLTELQPVWVWDLRGDICPILVNSCYKIESIVGTISFHIGVLAISEIDNQALYLNSDAETYLCGGWEYNPKKY